VGQDRLCNVRKELGKAVLVTDLPLRREETWESPTLERRRGQSSKTVEVHVCREGFWPLCELNK